MAPEAHTGSCHCKAVQYTAVLDLTGEGQWNGTFKCNCTICHKLRSWEAVTNPSDFTLVQGKAELTKYTFNKGTFPHYFCKICGTQVYLTGTLPHVGEQVMVLMQTLDDVKVDELGELAGQVKYFDNLNDQVSSLKRRVMSAC